MYKLTRNKENELFEVFEIDTNQVIFKSDDYDKASGIYKFVKDGGYFDGFTPAFMLIDFSKLIKLELDDEGNI